MEAKVDKKKPCDEILVLRMQKGDESTVLLLWDLPKLDVVWEVFQRYKRNPSSLPDRQA